jgi:hypothetical protein
MLKAATILKAPISPVIAVALRGAMGRFLHPLRWFDGQGIGAVKPGVQCRGSTFLPWLPHRKAWEGFVGQAFDWPFLGSAFSLYTVSLVRPMLSMQSCSSI